MTDFSSGYTKYNGCWFIPVSNWEGGFGQRRYRELLYKGFGTDSLSTILDSFGDFLNSSYDGFPLTNVQVTDESVEDGDGIWDCRATYGTRQPADRSPRLNVTIGDTESSGTTRGDTRHVNNAISTISTSGTTYSEADGLINFDGEGVQGTDIIVPAFNWQNRHIMSASNFTANISHLHGLTGFINSSQVTVEVHASQTQSSSITAEEHCLMYEGMDFGPAQDAEGDDAVEVILHFSYTPPRDNVNIPEVGDIGTVNGFDQVTIHVKEENKGTEEDPIIIPKPHGVYVYQIYPEGNLSNLPTVSS